MSTTVTYKGSTVTTVDDETKVLLTGGKYLEDDITLTDVASGGGLAYEEGTYTATVREITRHMQPVYAVLYGEC